jgi:hypothetical protein
LATAQFAGIIKITAVNCNAQKKICDEYGVKEFPTLKVSFPPHLRSLHRLPYCAVFSCPPPSLGADVEARRKVASVTRLATTH